MYVLLLTARVPKGDTYYWRPLAGQISDHYIKLLFAQFLELVS